LFDCKLKFGNYFYRICRLPLARIGLEFEIVNSDGCGFAGIAEKERFFGCGGQI